LLLGVAVSAPSILLLASPASAQSTTNAQPLPPIEVQTTAPKAKKQSASTKAKAKQQTAAPAPAAPQSPPSGQPTNGPETGTSPVKGFVAKVSGTGTKTDTPLLETPQAISVVTRDQFEQQGAQTTAQALLYTSGVAADSRTAFGGYDIFYSRGFNLDRYLDGLKYLVGGNITVPQMELYGLERLEVLHGPASMLYGASSPGGIVNAISKRPTDEPYHEIEFTLGNFDRVEAAFDFSGPVTSDKRWSYRLTGLASGVDSQVDFNDQERYWIAPALTWKPTAGTTLTFLGNLQHDPSVGLYSQIPSDGSLFPFQGRKMARSTYLGEPGYNFNTRDQQSIGYAFEHHLDDTWTVRQNLRYMHTDGDVGQYLPLPPAFGGSVNPVTGNMGRYRLTQTSDQDAFSVDTNAEGRFWTGPLAHTLLFGADYQHFEETAFFEQALMSSSINILNPQYGNLGSVIFAIPSNDRQVLNQTGIYVQDQVKWDRLIVTAGVRQDYLNIATDDLLGLSPRSEIDDEAFTKRFGVTYLLGAGLAPYASYSTSFQPQLGTGTNGQPFVPTTGEQYEVGIKYEPVGYKALFTVAAYDLTQQNVVTADLSNNRTQTGEIRSRGIEVEGKVSVTDKLDVIGSYTYADVEITETTDPKTLGKRPLNVPDQTAALWAFYTLRDGPLAGLGFGGGVRYVSDTAGTPDNSLMVPDYTLVDAAASYELGRISRGLDGTKLQLNVANVFDKEYVSQCSNELTCLYGNGRTFITSLKYQW
jgi:iron complex outermembrane receptor protein